MRIRRGRSSCSRAPTAIAPPASSSHGSAMLSRVGWDDWIRGAEVEPSLYGADFARLGEQIEALLDAGCRVFHFDVGDGHFVEPITMGPIVLQSISPLVHARNGLLDVHLMVENPAKY